MRDLEPASDELGDRPGSPHARSKVRVVIPPTAHILDQGHDVRRALRMVLSQPLTEQILHFVRKPKHHIARPPRAHFDSGLHDPLHLVVGQCGDNRRHEDSNRYVRLRQLIDRAKPRLRRSGARLQSALGFP
jgi:hypothetical protein